MRGFVANTDYDWFTFLRSIEPPIDEVNFWRPGSESSFRALQPGEPFFFKLKAPRNAIGGFGYFAHYSSLPVSMAWDVYREANGAPSYRSMRERLLNIQGKSYDLTQGEGERIWLECLARAGGLRSTSSREIAIGDRPISSGYGAPISTRPRLGQRSFRIVVLDAYQRRCAVTNERTLPALEAAHIREYHEVPEHSIDNGILFRADIHKLFDTGYVTVTPDYHFEVSRPTKEEFENGRDYYKLHGTAIRLPANPAHHPLVEALSWHNDQRYLG